MGGIKNVRLWKTHLVEESKQHMDLNPEPNKSNQAGLELASPPLCTEMLNLCQVKM